MYTPVYFKQSEFARCNPPCKLSDMSEDLMRKLDEARALCDLPFIVNSAYRSKEYERSRGRKGTSSHCKGMAVDLMCASSHLRQLMVSALIHVGFKRLGVYPTFIHADLDPDKVSAIWLNNLDITRG